MAATRLLCTIFDCRNAEAVAHFWAEALDYHVERHEPGEYRVRPVSGGGHDLYFMNVPEPKSGKNRLHVDVVTDRTLGTEVERLQGLGASVVGWYGNPPTQEDPDAWVVLQDPEGNEFCLMTSASVADW